MGSCLRLHPWGIFRKQVQKQASLTKFQTSEMHVALCIFPMVVVVVTKWSSSATDHCGYHSHQLTSVGREEGVCL